MAPEEFLSWWFAPWRWAGAAAEEVPYARDEIARRDGYRSWCARNEVPAALPADADHAWMALAATEGPALLATARLFGGLLAARGQDRALLSQLAAPERRWCMSIASLQPLAPSSAARYAARDGLEVRGMIEACRYVERDFPGIWPRLRLLLEPALGDRVSVLLKRTAREAAPPPHAKERVLRCWQLCRRRAGALH